MNCDLYQILNVDKNCSSEDLKKSYRKLCIKHHPDKGGDEQEFKKISEAYNILKDDEKRRIYDQYGMDGLKQGAGDENFHNMMQNMFGFPFGPQRSNKNQMVPIQIPLEMIVNGNPNYIYTHIRKIIDHDKSLEKCSLCKGEGKRLIRQSMGFMQMMQPVICPQCQGKCYQNISFKTVEEKINVPIPKHCQEFHKFILKNKMDEDSPNSPSGNVILEVHYKRHPVFIHKNYDLCIEIEISFLESLFGFNRTIKLLDNSSYEINYPSIIKLNEILFIPGKGLYNSLTKKNHDLFIFIKINYPDHITKTSILQSLSSYNQIPLKSDITVSKKNISLDQLFPHQENPTNMNNPHHQEQPPECHHQ